MKVQIALYAGLSKFLPAGAENRKATIDVSEGSSVREIIARLGIPDDHPHILLVNGRQARPETVLQDGETLAVFPPLAGG
jgi:molybdopterin converting factor small subunit